MTNIAKTGCAALLLALTWATPSEACVYQRVRPGPCPMGTVGGKCVNVFVATGSQCGARQVISDINMDIPGVPPTGERGTYDPLLRSNIRQPEYGLNSTIGLSGFGGQHGVYGRY
jgi:hypothetical protein